MDLEKDEDRTQKATLSLILGYDVYNLTDTGCGETSRGKTVSRDQEALVTLQGSPCSTTRVTDHKDVEAKEQWGQHADTAGSSYIK